MIIQNIFDNFRNKIELFDLELIISHILGKSREFVLAHPEFTIPKFKIKNLKLKIARRRRGEPLAYILGHKEFYGLDFKVTPDTLIPRPETELLVNESLTELRNRLRNKNVAIIDVGTGSGNIIISIVKNLNKLCHSRENGNPVSNSKVSALDSRLRGNDNCSFYATDISDKALSVAKFNAKKNRVNKYIKFIKSDLLDFLTDKNSLKIVNCKLIIASNLPYLSKNIYNSTPPDVRKFEPKSSLFSGNGGLKHYENLFKQIKILKKKYHALYVACYAEFSPEQKPKLEKLIKNLFPSAEINFYKDLAGKWRVISLKIKPK